LYLFAIGSMILMFGSAMSCLDQSLPSFRTIPSGAQTLWEINIGLLDTKIYNEVHEKEPVVLVVVWMFMIVCVIFFVNMLVAQLTCAYDSIYADMVGYARLKRIRIIVECMLKVSPKKWASFVKGLEFEKRMEFNEGDVGLAGCVQVLEPASQFPTTIDAIKRFGGSTSPSILWPEEENADDDTDKFERLEGMMKRMMERVSQNGAGGKKKQKGGSSTGMGGSSGAGGGGSAEAGGGSAGAGSQGSGAVEEEEAEEHA